MSKLAIALLVGLFGLSACGDKEGVVVYKQGNYSGKTDGKPWENAAFAGDKAKWDNGIRARGQNQNESKRIGD
ncbi:MAG: hypothetical protein WCV99_11670 [Sterolibacterium sp.]